MYIHHTGSDPKGEVWEAARRINLPLDQLLKLPDDEVAIMFCVCMYVCVCVCVNSMGSSSGHMAGMMT